MTTIDQHAATDVVARVFACLDDKRFEDMGAHFTDNVAAHTPGGTTHGRAAVVDHARAHHEHIARTQHHLTGAVVDITGDQARLRANQHATFADDQGRPYLTLGVVYRAELRHAAGEWRIASFGFEPVWSEQR